MDKRLLYWTCAPVGGAPAGVGLNAASILGRISEARARKARLLVLPELCLTGATCADLFRAETLLEAAGEAALRVAEACGDLLCVFGMPLAEDGRVYNVCAAAAGGELLGFVPKGGADGAHGRPFSPAPKDARSVSFRGRALPFGEGLLFPVPGAGGLRLGVSLRGSGQAAAEACRLARLGADVVAFPSAEIALAGESALRRARIAEASRLSGRLCLYANAGANESTTDAVYDGQALIAAGGALLSEGEAFSGEAAYAAADAAAGNLPPAVEDAAAGGLPPAPSPFPYAPAEGPLRDEWCREALEICARALAARLLRARASGAVVGVSGGVDSALALLSSRRALEILKLPPDRLSAITLPALGTTGRTRLQAEKLILALGLRPREIPIMDSVLRHFEDIGHPPGLLDAAYENAQARERTQVLMDIANMENAVMVGTGDMSELALGFTTFGGDHLSMYGVNGGLYKSAIRMILRWAARQAGGALAEVIGAILDTPVSPELLPPEDGVMSQRTENIVGPYELHDFFLYHFLSSGAGPERLLRLASAAFGESYRRDGLLKWMGVFFSRFFASQFKRSCSPDGPQALSLSLSPRGGLAMPSDACAAPWLEQIGRLKQRGAEDGA